jgi:hypothetical protein
MSVEKMEDMNEEALVSEERRQKRKREIWRWSIIGGSAIVLAAIIMFFVFGAADKNSVAAETMPTTVVTNPTYIPETIPEETEPVVDIPETTKPEPIEPAKPDIWVYDDNLSAEENIFIYLTEYLGYSNSSACGVIANIAYETGWKFDPTLGNPNGCYGLIQWLGNRLKNLKSWCKENDKDYHSIQGQLDFMDWELKNDDPYGTYEHLIDCEDSTKGAYSAGWYFCYWYERPNNKKSASEWRGGEAKEYYEAFVLKGDNT